MTPGLEENLNVKFIGDESVIKLTLGGQKVLQDSINDGSVIVEGNMNNARMFISLFDSYVVATQYAD